MNSKGKSVGYALIVTAMLMIVVFASASAIPTAKACVSGLEFYVNKDNPSPPNFYRSAAPWDFTGPNYDFLQSVTLLGGVISKLTPIPSGSPPYADLGVAYTFGKLGDITSIPVTGSGTYSVNIWIDMNTGNDGGGNGPFFSWSGDAFTGLDGDEYGLGEGLTVIINSGTITPASSFMLVSHGYATYTIAQLQSGAVAGIDSNTVVGFWFGIVGDPTTTRQFEIDTIGGEPVVCVAPPVGGEWVPINTVQMLVQIVGSAAAISAIAASFVGFKRIKREQD